MGKQAENDQLHYDVNDYTTHFQKDGLTTTQCWTVEVMASRTNRLLCMAKEMGLIDQNIQCRKYNNLIWSLATNFILNRGCDHTLKHSLVHTQFYILHRKFCFLGVAQNITLHYYRTLQHYIKTSTVWCTASNLQQHASLLHCTLCTEFLQQTLSTELL